MPAKILVVDDEPDILDLVELSIASEGFDVIKATNGEEAIQQAERESPQLILLDISMPGMDGFETLEALRENPETEAIPVILLTARAQISDKLRGISSGAEDYITKPFNPSELIERVKSSLKDPEPSGGRVETLKNWSGEITQLAQHLEAASEIQQALLPKESPSSPGLDIAGDHQSSLNVSGDFYDFIALENGQLGIAIADIKGKGIPAALLMVMARTALRIAARELKPPHETLKKVNDFLADETEADMFATMVYAVVNPRTRAFAYSNGGHNYPVLARADGNLRYLKRGGPLVGSFPEAQFETETIHLETGDRILLYTDGAADMLNEQGEPFGEDRLADIVQSGSNMDAEELCGAVRQQLNRYNPDPNPADDMTIVAVYASP